MNAIFDGIKVKIPNGYKLNANGFYQNGHGVEYALVQYNMVPDNSIKKIFESL